PSRSDRRCPPKLMAPSSRHERLTSVSRPLFVSGSPRCQERQRPCGTLGAGHSLRPPFSLRVSVPSPSSGVRIPAPTTTKGRKTGESCSVARPQRNERGGKTHVAPPDVLKRGWASLRRASSDKGESSCLNSHADWSSLPWPRRLS